MALSTILAFVNAVFMGAGAKVWDYPIALWAGFFSAALIIPVFCFRHYVQEKALSCPMLEDSGSPDRTEKAEGRRTALSRARLQACSSCWRPIGSSSCLPRRK